MRITKNQKEVYDYIVKYGKKNGYAPTQKEIKEHFGLKSFGSVQRYLKYLIEAGHLESDWNARRGLKPVENPGVKASAPSNSLSVPLLGDVAAGNPIEAIEKADEHIQVPFELLPKNTASLFALRVRGDSMIEDGILENDVIICRQQKDARQGQTVVAVINGEATVKNFYRQKSTIELHPANHRLKPFVLDENSGDVHIAGVLVGLIRSYE